MNWFHLSEDVIIFKSNEPISFAGAIRALNFLGVIDVVPADDEVAVQIAQGVAIDQLVHQIHQLKPIVPRSNNQHVLDIPVCYEFGEDMSEVLAITSMSQKRFIDLHTANVYRASYGFTPGFIYLSGLPEQIHCPRKDTPRTKVPAGSVGIGGSKTGIYSLESPGGWQIIGRTPLTLFNSQSVPPALVTPGEFVRFIPISKKKFDDWN